MSPEDPPWHHPGYVAVLELVAARAGLLPPSCPPSAMEGIQRAMARASLAGDFTGYLARLEDGCVEAIDRAVATQRPAILSAGAGDKRAN